MSPEEEAEIMRILEEEPAGELIPGEVIERWLEGEDE